MIFGVSSTKLRQEPIWCGTIRAVLRYIYHLLAVCRLRAGKYAGILTYFQIKVNKNCT